VEIIRMVPARKKSKPDFPRPTAKLSSYTAKIRKRILHEFDLTDSQIILLDESLQWLDEARLYQRIVAAEGVEVENPKTLASRPNPALSALKNARSCFLTAWRILDLKVDAEKIPPGRPARKY
jgi:hypothetical protein